MKKIIFAIFLLVFYGSSFAQDTTIVNADTIEVVPVPDTVLRILELNPYFTLHVDSTLSYKLRINKNPANYFWYLKNAPLGLRIHREYGIVSFKADKSYFLSGKLKYDVNYKVNLGVQNKNEPNERIDTSFTIVFYNTEIIPSIVKPSVSKTLTIEEGENLSFRVFCEDGNFPIENIITLTDIPISKYHVVQKCGDEFSWVPPYDFVKESDPNKEKLINIHFIGANKFQIKDTAIVKLVVKNALDYPLANEEFRQVEANINSYVTLLKYTFLQLDKKLKKTKNLRTTFDLTSATTSLTGTIMSTSGNANTQRNGKILPSVGLALVPIKEASVPNKMVDQNQAALIRTSIKRLEYMIQDNQLLGLKDPEIIRKTNKLKEELKQVQIQLMEVPIELNTDNLSEEELDRYFNSNKVNKKYRLGGR